MEGVPTLLVSLACLLQFGSNEEDEIAQRSLQHAAFREYRRGELSRSETIQRIAASYKVTDEYVDHLLWGIRNRCEVQETLMSAISSCSSSHRLVGWIDIPNEEWEMIYCKFRDLLDMFFYLVSNFPSADSKKSTVIVDGEVERASLLNAQGWIVVPYSQFTKPSCLYFLASLQLPSAILKGKNALKKAIKETDSQSIVQVHGQKKYMLEYFAPALALLAHNPPNCNLELPKEMHSVLQTLTKIVTSGEPFGFNGFDFRYFRPDCDTMSLSTYALHEHGFITNEHASAVLDIILANVNSEGVVMVYLDPIRPRVDIAVLANVIFLAYLVGRESDPIVQHQELLVQQFLLGKGYLWGTPYYPQPESFMFYYGRLLYKFSHKIQGHQQLLEALKSALVNRSGDPTSSPLDAAKRLLLCSMFGIDNWADKELLQKAQIENGSWPRSVIYSLPTTKGIMHNEVVDLCFILTALSV